jgi:hypothetical protein
MKRLSLEDMANVLNLKPVTTEKVVVEPSEKLLNTFSAYFEPISGSYYACTPMVASNLELQVISEWPLKLK